VGDAKPLVRPWVAVVAEPPSIDCHAVNTFAFSHPARPHYSTLLKFSGNHHNLRIVGDLVDDWRISSDGLIYTFALHKGVRFHDNAEMTSADVKASYERIISSAPGVTSARRNLYSDIAAIETPTQTRSSSS
jgi:peptide/nickel transport system substrate-binding protein